MSEWATPPRCFTCNDSDLVEVGPVTTQCPEPHRTMAGKIAGAFRGAWTRFVSAWIADPVTSQMYDQADAQLKAQGR